MVNSIRDFCKLIAKRDNMPLEEVEQDVAAFRECLKRLIEKGATLEDLEEEMAWWFGLEPDYLEIFLF